MANSVEKVDLGSGKIHAHADNADGPTNLTAEVLSKVPVQQALVNQWYQQPGQMEAFSLDLLSGASDTREADTSILQKCLQPILA
eukprot:CAMPEP_0204276298 /NCGR_PEP_ID=MMETSP0468-20130131/27795_1 /ASSEMBLY_ACC=CAM_ASM_000383 /TAXON_ID=2969 /ORGANISM="Oxyrrhis marina" /LENGTH=84 /DNA_ID=CAMNT_0051252871 /DNA_START=651 /DNA_END=906 /DNA_ORIENTATION=+